MESSWQPLPQSRTMGSKTGRFCKPALSSWQRRGCPVPVVEAQRKMGSEVVVEVTGDCILLDPEIIDMGVTTYLEKRL